MADADTGGFAADGPARSGRLQFLFAFLIGAAGMSIVQFATKDASGNDTYYHMRMASLLPSWGFVHQFPWLRWTFFRDEFVSHHHGFHIALMPFVLASERLTGDAVLGGKLFCIVCMGTTTAALWAILRSLNAQYPLLWVALLGGAPWHFWMRLSFVRAPALAMPMLLLAVLFVIRRRMVLLGVLAFLFTHIYGGAVLFPLIPLSFIAGELLGGRLTRRSFTPLIASLVGMGAGLVVHPYFPENIPFMYTQIFETGLAAPGEVGTEWKSYDGWFFVGDQAHVLLGILAVCLMRRMLNGGRMDARSIGLLILNIGFLVLTLHSRRFIEYWPAFAMLNAADLASIPRGPENRNAKNGSFLNWIFGHPLELGVAACIVAVVAPAVTAYNNRQGINLKELKTALEAVAARSDAGSMILTDDWDIFPYCFYFDQHNTYAVGLDPVFTLRRYPAMWERYRYITRGQAPNYVSDTARKNEDAQNEKESLRKQAGQAKQGSRSAELAPNATSKPAGKPDKRRIVLDDIRDAFDADYVLVQSNHQPLFRQLRAAPEKFKMIYPSQPTSSPASNLRTEAQPPISVFEVIRTKAAGT